MIRTLMLAIGLVLIGGGAPALAQIGLPSLPGGVMPTGRLGDLPGQVTGRTDPLERQLRAMVEPVPSSLRRLVGQSRGRLEADPDGWPIVRGEILAVDPDPIALDRAGAAGFSVLRETRMEGLDLTVVVLAPPQGMALGEGVSRLSAINPQGSYTFNHIHGPAGSMVPLAGSTAGPAPMPSSGRRLGLIDTGVEGRHPSLVSVALTQQGFAGPVLPAAHGTAVASLLAGRAPDFAGAAPGADLYAADVYGGSVTGGSAEALARALGWMASHDVRVINISLVGPRNPLVEVAVRRLVGRGYLLVAAVGNDGPAAPPLFPAAYPGVIGVTAVSGRNRVLPEAGRGAQVDFAAPGADMAAASMDGGYATVRGASFAAPIVAGLLAERMTGDAGAQALSALAQDAQDMGAAGDDPVYGRGLVGAGLRVAPRAVGARGRLTR
ncbi:S8 family serine peptidase [Brevundimonas sp.]|uniref:S8 family serine peptidase n=1 Tax=Brevundimonas sp. TaxID=1871086 RepID=UPI002488F165|nr:S8 family serine peptidase [Brevundimonas sp.]MDI1282668.1 S8 family serine peptidase [Brevundimonas sp.]